MKIQIRSKRFEIEMCFMPGNVLPWQANGYRITHCGARWGESGEPQAVASGTTPDTALQAIALELSEAY